MPKRIQLRRTKGWKKPENTVVVSRPTRWGNPYKVGDDFGGHPIADQETAVYLFQTMLRFDDEELAQWYPTKEEIRSALKGKDLACWCPEGTPCHADALLVIANAPT